MPDPAVQGGSFEPTIEVMNEMKDKKEDKQKDKNVSLSDAEKEEAIKKLEESLEDCC